MLTKLMSTTTLIDPRVLTLRRVCYYLAERLPPDCPTTAKDIFNELKKGFHGVHNLNPDWSIPVKTPSNHNLIVITMLDERKMLKIIPLLKFLWSLYYPELVPKRRHKFEYAEFMSCNPLAARPPAYIDIGFESRVMCDQIFMSKTQRSVVEPLNNDSFEIVEDDFEIIEDD